MKILVTGAAGFVGSFVCRKLIAEGHSVTAAIEPGSTTIRLADLAGTYRPVEIDLFRAPQFDLDQLASGIDLAIHAAWYAVPGKYLTSLENITALSGSLNLMATLWKSGCRKVVGIGTCVEYRMDTRPLREDSPCEPSILYAAAKWSTFLTGQQLARQLGGAFAWARLFYLYGPQEAPARLIPDLATNLLQGKRVAVTEGRQIRDYLHIEDVASAIVAIALSDVEGPCNIGSGEATSVREIIETLARISGGKDLVDFGARAANLLDPPYIVADTTKLREQTGWRPAYTLESGLAHTIDWWKQHLAR